MTLTTCELEEEFLVDPCYENVSDGMSHAPSATCHTPALYQNNSS